MTTTQSGIEIATGSAEHLRPQPRPAYYSLPWSIALLVGDLGVAVVAALLAASFTRVSLNTLVTPDNALAVVLCGTAIWLSLFERIGMYRRSFSTSTRDEIYAALAASVLAMLPAAAIFLLVPTLYPERNLLLIALVITAVGVSLERSFAHSLRTHVFPPSARRIAVIGTQARVDAVPRDLSLTASDRVTKFSVDSFDDDLAGVVASGDLLQLEWLATAIASDCNEFIVTEALPAEIMPALLRLTEARGIKLAFAPMRIRPHACDFVVRRDGGLALLYPRSLTICTPGVTFVRRLFDLAIAVPALILLSPVMLAIALAIVIDSGAPIFYRQTRVGKHGREFAIIKFRTMRPDAEAATGPVWARSGEARTTRIGKFLRRASLDELPQLINVVCGEMSIVGPRPERPFYVEQFRKLMPRYDERHLVSPGITGWSHIHMRRNVDTSAIGERLSYDLFYLEHWSIFLDVLIICKTAAEFLFHSAAA